MQATVNYPQSNWRSRFGWFSIGPLAGLIIVATMLLLTTNSYAEQHRNKIYTGVYVAGYDFSEMTLSEAEDAISVFSSTDSATITLIDSSSGQEWQWTHNELGLNVDAEKTAEMAFQIGRNGQDLSLIHI